MSINNVIFLCKEPGKVSRAFNPSTQKTDAGGSLSSKPAQSTHNEFHDIQNYKVILSQKEKEITGHSQHKF